MDLLNYSIPFLNNSGMTQQQVKLVQQSWKLFRGINPEIIGDVFYTRLFTKMPALKRMFKSPMQGQYTKLVDMLSMIVGRLHNLDEVTEDIKQMAKRHTGYGVKQGHYKVVKDSLLWTLKQGLGSDWNEDVEEAWATCYNILANTMIEASGY